MSLNALSSGPRVGLALGGGAARGYAHIGVLEVLAEHGLRPAMVAGTSAGAVVGAAYAAGISTDAMRQVAAKLTWSDLTEPVIPRRSLLGTRRLEVWLDGLLEGRTFAELAIPFCCVAADILTGEEVRLGDPALRVSLAVRASCAVPGIFPPVRISGRLLVDGGILGSVPVRAVRAMGGAPVLAVAVAGGPFAGPEPQTIVATLAAAINIMQQARDEQDLSEADLVLTPSTGSFSPTNLGAAPVLMQAGRQAALAALPALRKLWASEDPGSLESIAGEPAGTDHSVPRR